MESIKNTYQLIISYLEYYQETYSFGYFLFLIVLSVIFAQIIDILFSSFLYRLVKKTETKIDDQIISILHKPLYYSFLFIGLRFAILTQTFQFSEKTIFFIIALFKTIAIFLWSFALLKIFILIIKWYSSKHRNSKNINFTGS